MSVSDSVELMLSSLSVTSIPSGLISMLVCLLMRSFVVVIILFVMTFSLVMVCLWMKVCVISGIVISFRMVMQVPFMFCCRFVEPSTYGIGFLLFCCCSLSMLWFRCLFSACSVVIILLFSMLFSCIMCISVFRSVTSFSIFWSVVFLFCLCVVPYLLWLFLISVTSNWSSLMFSLSVVVSCLCSSICF